MPCNGYTPRFQDQINPLDPLGSLNCTCYSGAMAGEYHTCGAVRPNGKSVRYYTGDKVGGTTLPQVDYALRRGYNIDLDTRIGSARLTWPTFVNYINSGRGAILQGSYSAIHGTRFQGDLRFTGNHAIFVPPGWRVMDPLCDGRYPGIYKYRGEVYPQSMLKSFAGRLVLDPNTGRRLGYGYVWASLTRDNTSTTVTPYRARVVPRTGDTYRLFDRYFIQNGIIVDRETERTKGFSAYCTAPRLYSAKSGLSFRNKSLVRLTSGSRAGWYIVSAYAHEV